MKGRHVFFCQREKHWHFALEYSIAGLIPQLSACRCHGAVVFAAQTLNTSTPQVPWMDLKQNLHAEATCICVEYIVTLSPVCASPNQS